jgi:glycosyltransferase involved in cell wall biosynthesis
MSVVFVSTWEETFTPTQSGALATVIYECCRAARVEGCEPFVISRNCNAAPYDWPRAILLDYPSIPTSGPRWWLARMERKIFGWQHAGQRAFAHRMAQAIADNKLQKFPLVVLNNPETAILLRQKFPEAFIAHWFENQLECKPRVQRELKNAVDAAWGVSDFTARWIENYYGFSTGSVPTVYNATDNAHFAPAGETVPVKTVLAGSTPDASGAPVVNFVGRTGREKAPDLLLKAALQLAKKKLKFSIQIVGSNHWDNFTLDDYQRELKHFAAQLQESGIEVRFTGHVARADLPGVLRRADINVVPSRWDEPFGMVTLEGMACGVATIASSTGGTPEVVGDAALLFERENVEELATQLQKLIEDEALRREYSRRGRERAEEFTWQRTWRRIKELTTL